MIPITRTSTPTRSLVEYWNEARLRVGTAKSSSVRPAPGIVPWRIAIEDVLKVGYGIQTQPRFLAGAWQEVRWRTTPSAGALYPFEVIATIVGEGSYLWDIEKGRLVPYDVPPILRDELSGAGLVTRPRHRVEALLTFVARPFQSMKKYFLRGYTYCHLDAGHTATNLALYTAALGHDPILHLRFSRQFLVEHLKLDGLCREPLAVLSFATAEAVLDPAQDAAPAAEAPHRPVGLELPGEREIQSWESLQGLLSFDVALQPFRPPRCRAAPVAPGGQRRRLPPAAPGGPAAAVGRGSVAFGDPRPALGQRVPRRAGDPGRHRRSARRAARRSTDRGLLAGEHRGAGRAPRGPERRRDRRHFFLCSGQPCAPADRRRGRRSAACLYAARPRRQCRGPADRPRAGRPPVRQARLFGLCRAALPRRGSSANVSIWWRRGSAPWGSPVSAVSTARSAPPWPGSTPVKRPST